MEYLNLSLKNTNLRKTIFSYALYKEHTANKMSASDSLEVKRSALNL